MSPIDGSTTLGPDGVKRRIQEIQARMESLLGAQAKMKPQSGAGFDGSLAPFDVNSAGVTLRGVEPSVEMKGLVDSAAKANNVDPALLDSLVQTESSYDPAARSRAGAMGLSQLMPDTARSMGVANPFDPAQNLHGGAKYLRGLLDRFGDLPKAVAAYNAGPGAVERHGGIPPYAETQAYVRKVLAGYEARKSQ